MKKSIRAITLLTTAALAATMLLSACGGSSSTAAASKAASTAPASTAASSAAATEINVAYIIADHGAEPVTPGVSVSDMVRRGVTPMLASSPVAQAAVAAGVDLLGGDDE